MKKVVAFLLTLSALFGFCACGSSYVSSYNALGMVRNQTNRNCSTSF